MLNNSGPKIELLRYPLHKNLIVLPIIHGKDNQKPLKVQLMKHQTLSLGLNFASIF